MIATTLAAVADAVGGTLHGDDAAVTGPAFLDSRRVEAGGLFVAFAGERVDGHAYAGTAVAAGAAGVLGSRPTGVPTVVVADVQAALQELARVQLRQRRASDAPLDVLALTGSQGKTSVKDLLGHVLGAVAPTVATAGSFNNELGLPLTVLRADDATRYLVLEMGARGIGHLRDLCDVAPPDVSLVLNVGTAHIGEFGSREAIAQAKGELVEALGAAGTAVLNADDHRVAAMASRTPARVLTFGTGDADVRLADVVEDDLGRPSFTLAHGDVEEPVVLRLLGRHHATNAAAVAAAALAVGVPLERAAAALREVSATSPWRMELAERPDGVRVVNDAYNANPDSVRAALGWLGGVGRRTGARTVAVLGAMLELGDSSAAEHREVGRLVGELGVDHLVVVGEGADDILTGAGDHASPLHVRDVHDAVLHLRETVRAPDVVLVKASRGVGLERVVDGLLAEEGNPQ